MLNNEGVPLLRAAVTEPLILAAQTVGSPVEKVLRSVGLPMYMLDDPYMLIPEVPAWHFVNAIYRMEGDPLFGLKAAMELAHQDIESVKPLLQGCANLNGLLKRFIAVAPSQSSVNNYELMEDGELLWFMQKGFRLTSDYAQVELFEIAGMIQLVQLVAGEDWRPPEIHFSFKYDSHVNHSEHLNPSKIHFSKPYPGIAIPRDLLPTELPELGGSGDVQAISVMPDSISDQLLVAVKPYIGERTLNKSLLSDITGMRIRTLQRKLARENSNYFEIIDRARFEKSKLMLLQTDEKLLNISLMLGYENASTFSRAFKRWAGVTPTEFRKHNPFAFSVSG